jgi:hypothetical protein
VTFTKALTIYHSWIHPLHHSLIPPFPHSWNSFNLSHFSIFIHEYIIFPLYSPSYTLFLYLPSPIVTIPRQDLFHLPFSIFEKSHFCLFKIATQEVSVTWDPQHRPSKPGCTFNLYNCKLRNEGCFKPLGLWYFVTAGIDSYRLQPSGPFSEGFSYSTMWILGS